jgi:hypothetical protein
MTGGVVGRNLLTLRNLSIGACGALIVSVTFHALDPILGTLSNLLVLSAIFFTFGLSCIMSSIRSHITGYTLSAAFVTAFLINCVPIPALSIGAHVGFYVQLARYKDQLDMQCASTPKCKDSSHVSTLQTEGYFLFIQGLARDDSGELLNIIKNHGLAPSPLQGCENGLVHLYGPYFHWECG